MNQEVRSTCAKMAPPGSSLPGNTQEKIRMRTLRRRKQNFVKIVPMMKSFIFALLMTAMFYVALTQLRHLFFHTSYFALRSIEITGNEMFEREKIILMADIAPGQNVILLNRERAREKLLRQPAIKEVNINMSGLRNMIIEIVERKPFMYIKSGINYYTIDEEGVIISIGNLADIDRPFVTGVDLAPMQTGDSVAENDAFYIAKKWLRAMPANISANISEINFSSLQNPYIYLLEGLKVYPSNLDDFIKRYDFLCALLDNLRDNNVEPIYLDMRAPSEIVIRPKKIPGALEGSRNTVVGG